MDDFVRAEMYDQMINWDSRLSREIPVIIQYFDDLGDDAVILDVACSSGRHSFALHQHGYQTIGVDISPDFIQLAEQLLPTEGIEELSRFIEIDASTEALLDELGNQYVDGAILLGNAIANMGDLSSGKQLLRNIFVLLRPGGKFFVQTVNKPEKPWYNPLRQKDGIIVQRIMVPETSADTAHNMVLHVNQIDAEMLEYREQKADNLFFMYRKDEFEDLVERIGFDVDSVYSGYERSEVKGIDGETLIWELSKPEIPLTDAGRRLFASYANMDEKVVRERTLELWQLLIRENWYHCIRGYRFLHPRIKAHPQYNEIVEEKRSTAALDIACHVGTDLRQLYTDGVDDLTGIDISQKFIEMGYKLYNDEDTDTGAKIEFIVDDIVGRNFNGIISGEALKTDYNRFYHHFGIIHSGSLIHLLGREEIMILLDRVYAMLATDGIFFGRTVGIRAGEANTSGLRFLHTVDSLHSALNDVGFTAIDVFEMPRDGPIGESSTSTTLQLGFSARK